jgi:NADPH-dependent curcumin reductase CurA
VNSIRTRRELAKTQDGDRTHGGGVVNRRIVLKRNPEGEPTPSDFEVMTEEVLPIAEAQMLLRTKWLTLDPYMRGLDASGHMSNSTR